MPFSLGILFVAGSVMAVAAAGLHAPVTADPAGSVDRALAARAVASVTSGAETTVTSTSRTRLEVWASPTRIAKIKPGRSRTISVQAVETMAEWRVLDAVITARSTAGRITPKRTQSSKGHPAKFRLTRTSGSSSGFVTLTATTNKYGTAKRVVSWGPVPLPRTLTGTLTYVTHYEDEYNGLVSDDRQYWNVTFQLVSRSSGDWMGAAVYQLSSGTWSAVSRSSGPDDSCVGEGNGRAAGGTLRYSWRGKAISTGAGAYWIDVTSTDQYLVRCVSDYESSKTPQFTFGFKPATGGIRPDHLKGSLTVRLDPSDGNDYDSWTWNLSGS